MKDKEKIKNLQEWISKVEAEEAFCYIKPTKNVHESGFGCFEVGYLEMNHNSPTVKNHITLGRDTDLVLGYPIPEIPIRMDLTLDGYIRIFGFGGALMWDESNSLAMRIISVERKNKDGRGE